VERLAASLSVEYGVTLAVFYDDRCGVSVAILFRDGTPVRDFGEADEVWVPLDEDGDMLTDGPRYTRETLPPDAECDCIRQAIDVGLEAAGFCGWMTASDLQDIVGSDDGWLAERDWQTD
jgi:hypothetical protein